MKYGFAGLLEIGNLYFDISVDISVRNGTYLLGRNPKNGLITARTSRYKGTDVFQCLKMKEFMEKNSFFFHLQLSFANHKIK